MGVLTLTKCTAVKLVAMKMNNFAILSYLLLLSTAAKDNSLLYVQ